ncbi:MAG TPA: carboxypeptidase-like regulatory domain-containing protein [Micromonospora sp.]
MVGRVVDAAGAPVPGATVTVTVGPVTRSTTTGAEGTYRLVAVAGSATVTANAYGYRPEDRTLDLPERATSTTDFAVAEAPRRQVSGTVVRDTGQPLASLTVTLLGTPLPSVTTGADGGFAFADVPEGRYQLGLSGNRCLDGSASDIVVDGDLTLRPVAPARHDVGGYGYTCEELPANWIAADNVLVEHAYGGGGHVELPVDLPLAFRMFGEFYDRITIWGDGRLAMRNRTTTEVAAYWDRLFLDDRSSIRTKVVGTAPHRQYVIEWRDLYGADHDDWGNNLGEYRVSFEALLGEDGTVTYQYRDLDNPVDSGKWATVGIWSYNPPPGMYYSWGEPALSNDVAVRFRPRRAESPRARYATPTTAPSSRTPW